MLYDAILDSRECEKNNSKTSKGYKMIIIKKILGGLLVASTLYFMFIQLAMALSEKTTWPPLDIFIAIFVTSLEIVLLVIGLFLLIK